MENTCVLTVLPVIPRWETYNLPLKKSIQYCLVLKQKRDFSSLREKLYTQTHLKNISCSIVDKHVNQLENASTFNVMFLNETGEMHFLLSLSLSVKEKYALKRKNNLLIILKNYNKNINFQLQNDNVYVKCNSEIQWDIFYKLYRYFLLEFSFSNIGSIFYTTILSNWFIRLEKMFLYQSACGIKKSSSVLPVCHANKTAKKLVNILKACDGNTFSKTALSPQKNFKDSRKCISSELNGKLKAGSLLKRKTLWDEQLIHLDKERQKLCKLNHCTCEKIQCKCFELEWKLYRSISKPSISSYMNILLSKSNHFETKQFSSQDSNFSASEFLSNHKLSNPVFNINEKCTESMTSQSLKVNFNSSVLAFDEIVSKITQDSTDSKLNSRDLKSFETYMDPQISLSSKVNSENKALKDEIDLSPKREITMSFKEPTYNSKLLFSENDGKDNISELFNDFIEGDNVSKRSISFDLFQTASGKKVNISNSALKAAEKMLAEALQTEHLSENNKENENQSRTSAKNHLSSASDNFNDSLDHALAEKMFEDISFDEKEFSPAVELSSTFSENVIDKISSVGKVRKSLGGRRSLKPYSVPKL